MCGGDAALCQITLATCYNNSECWFAEASYRTCVVAVVAGCPLCVVEAVSVDSVLTLMTGAWSLTSITRTMTLTSLDRDVTPASHAVTCTSRDITLSQQTNKAV